MFKAGEILLVVGEITLVAGEITLVAGGWGTEALILLRLALQTIVGRGSPCPVLQQEVEVFTPLSNGEGTGVGLIVGRWSPCHVLHE